VGLCYVCGVVGGQVMAIIDLSDLKTHLGVTDSSQDTILQMIVDATNQYVSNYCHRKFEASTYSELYDGPGQAALVLKNRPVTGIISVLENNITIDERTEVGGVGYYQVDINQGILWRDDHWGLGYGNVQVAYEAGYSEIPSDLMFATLRTAEYFYNTSYYRTAGVSGENLGAFNFRLSTELSSMGGGLVLPDVLILNILNRYREKGVTYSHRA
jgi:hypothetical protein